MDRDMWNDPDPAWLDSDSDSEAGAEQSPAAAEWAGSSLPGAWRVPHADDADPLANAFGDELLDVSASDWNVDADLIWGPGDSTFSEDPDLDLPFA